MVTASQFSGSRPQLFSHGGRKHLHYCGADGSRDGGSNGRGGSDGALEARVQELEQRLAQSEAERRQREAQHERDAQVGLCITGLERSAAKLQQAAR